MVHSIDRLPPITKPSAVEPIRQKSIEDTPNRGSTVPFNEVLDREFGGTERLNFSNHAQSRLLTRQIQLSGDQLARLQQGVYQAAQKGAKDSLVMLDNLAFIVSVSNRTVVTALDGAARTGNVFTQIDSAVIV
jgi:flagellar operon protein